MRAFLSLLKNKNSSFYASLLIAVVGLVGLGTLHTSKVAAACSNDIMCGGFSSRSNFISKVKDSSELQHIYAAPAYGLTSSMYDDFAAHAKQGTAYKNGTIVVDGRTVGTNANSIGRLASYQGAGYYTKHIDGAGTFYGNDNQHAFASNSLPIMVLFDSSGKAIFAVLNDCGNPSNFTPTPPPAPPKPAPTPTYACVQLVGAILNKGTNTYQLTVTGSYANGATPVSADFNFGDGKVQNGVKLGTTATTSHAYPAASKVYTASATLHFLASGKAVSTTSAKCKTPITVTIPYCQALTGAIIDASKYEAQFTATGVLNGRTLSSADFNFGDGSVQNGVKPSAATKVVVTHNYATGGTYNATATLHFSANGQSYTAPTCRALVKPTTIVSECKPGVPVGDTRCEVCQYDSSLPPDSPSCQPPCTDTGDTTGDTPNCTPAALPNTGAGDTIAIFSAVVVGGFLLYRQVIYRRHKAAFMAAEQGTSALPLADATSPTDPLRGTPLEPKGRRGTFRRRQF